MAVRGHACPGGRDSGWNEEGAPSRPAYTRRLSWKPRAASPRKGRLLSAFRSAISLDRPENGVVFEARGAGLPELLWFWSGAIGGLGVLRHRLQAVSPPRRSPPLPLPSPPPLPTPPRSPPALAP